MKIISGKYYSRALEAPKNKGTRPSTSLMRGALFNILQQEVEGTDFLDIFAGSGAVGIEALSRGARLATFIENDTEALKALRNNLKKLEVAPQTAIVLYGDYLKNLKLLGRNNKQFDLIFADAPYHAEVMGDLIQEITTGHLLKKSGKLFIENDKPFDAGLNLCGLLHVNSRKLGKSHLHQFQHE